MFWKPWLSRILLLLLSFTLVQCSKKQESTKDTLIVALDSSPKTMDPRYATDANGQRIANLLFHSLVRLGPDLKIIGDAAAKWELINNQYHFELRKDIRFANGDPLTKEDLVFTFNEYQNSSSPYRSALKVIEKVEVTDLSPGFKVVLHLKEFSASLLVDLSPIKILSKKIVEKYGDDFSSHIMGSGSFELVKQSATELHLRANPYATIKPKIAKLIFKIIKDETTRYLKIRKGSIDIAQSVVPSSRVKEFKENDNFHVYEYPGLAMNYILINLKDTDLSQLEFRQAIAHAINRDEIIRYKLDGLGTPATSILTPGNPFFSEKIAVPIYDLKKATAIVKKLGLIGKEFTLKSSNQLSAVENAKVIANQLEKTGIKVKLQSFEWGTFYGDIKSGNFQLATMRWVGATDPDIYRIAFHSKEHPPGRNRGYYKNSVIDSLVEKGTIISNLKERIEHYKKVQEIIMKDLPIIPLWYNKSVAVINKRVHGYSPPKNGDFSPLVTVQK